MLEVLEVYNGAHNFICVCKYTGHCISGDTSGWVVILHEKISLKYTLKFPRKLSESKCYAIRTIFNDMERKMDLQSVKIIPPEYH